MPFVATIVQLKILPRENKVGESSRHKELLRFQISPLKFKSPNRETYLDADWTVSNRLKMLSIGTHYAVSMCADKNFNLNCIICLFEKNVPSEFKTKPRFTYFFSLLFSHRDWGQPLLPYQET